jgi:hypothetical protein
MVIVNGYLNGLVPIHALLVDGTTQKDAASLNFDSKSFDISIDPLGQIISIATAAGSGVFKNDTFSPLLPFSHNSYMIAPNDGGPVCIGVLAGSTPKPGVQIEIDFPGGSVSALSFSSQLNVSGDGTFSDAGGVRTLTNLDVTKDYALRLEWLYSGEGVGRLVKKADADVTAPTIVSATVTGTNPDQLSVLYSEVVIAPNTTGLSLPFTGGTPRTITGVLSGSGTNTVVFSLSGSFTGTEVCKLVCDATRTQQDPAGNFVATNGAGTSVTVAFSLASSAAFTMCWEADKALLPSGGLPANFTSWTDQVGGSTQLTQAGAGHATVATGPSVQFTNNINQRLHASMVAGGLGASFGLYARISTDDGAASTPVSFDCDGSASIWVRLDIQSDRIIADVYNGAEHTTQVLLTVGTGFHDVFLEKTGGVVTLTVDALTPATVSDAQTFTGLTNVSIGNMIYASGTVGPGNHRCRAFAYKASAVFTTQEKTDILAYAAAHL